MGFGDELIGSGLARGAKADGRRVAFGDGERIYWSPQAHQVFRGNPNVAPPGDEEAADLRWIAHYRGHRLYGVADNKRWHFRDFRCAPGEIFFDGREQAIAADLAQRPPFIILEPGVKPQGACAGVNKQWAVDRYEQVAALLNDEGFHVFRFAHSGAASAIPALHADTFRVALAMLSAAALYVGPEGGLHHGAAAVGVPAVVIFGGFNTPRATGYEWHANLTVGEPCGSIAPCEHCRQAMDAITVEHVYRAALAQLERRFS